MTWVSDKLYLSSFISYISSLKGVPGLQASNVLSSWVLLDG